MESSGTTDQRCLIRRATADDAVAIQSLYQELVDDSQIHVLPDQIAALAESPVSFLLVAEADGVVCATALLNVCADVMYVGQPFGVVENVIVSQDIRGRGLGKLLLAHVERLAIERDCTKLMLLSGSHRPEAHAFFRSCGFAGETKQAFVKYRSQFGTR
ncbi:MAG: GNAT family N-acetyltransferase [Verrucomicrobiaceae bacterium]|nr:MAG: GNAT family N-acetyltransferase [Verrucomicrobiaceae bacterium]